MTPVTIRASRPRTTVVAVAVAAVPLIGAGILWNQARVSTPVSVEDAVHAFRAADGPATRIASAPAPGVYTYRATGHERGSLGPVGIDRDVPAHAQMVVTPSPGGFTTELQVSEQHVEAYRYVVRGGWITTTWRRVDVTFLGMGRDDRRELEPAARAIPVHPTVGARWTLDYHVAKLHTTGTAEVVSEGRIDVDGTPERAVLVRTTTRTSGAHGGTRREETWWSPRLGLPLRIRTQTRLNGVVSFRATLDLALQSVTPVR